MPDASSMSEDQLWAELPESEDRQRVQILCELSERAMLRSDFDRAQTLVDTARETAETVTDQCSLGLVLSTEALLAGMSCNFEKAVPLYDRAAQALWSVGMMQNVADMLLGKADCLVRLGRWSEAAAACVEALELEKHHDGTRGRGEFLHAVALREMGQLTDALAAGDRARTHYERHEDLQEILYVDDFRIHVLCDLEELKQAQDVARNMLNLNPDAPRAIRTHQRLADILQRRGQNDKALRHLRKAAALCKDSKDWTGTADCHRRRAAILANMGHLKKAQSFMAKAAALYQATGRTLAALDCKLDAAVFLSRRGRLKQCAKMAREVIAESRWYPDRSHTAAILLLLSLFRRQRYYECARTAEELLDLWPEGTTAADERYADLLGVLATARYQVGITGEAAAMATHVLKHAQHNSLAEACALDIRIRHEHRQGTAIPARDLARAVQAHLAFEQTEQARQLVELVGGTEDLEAAA